MIHAEADQGHVSAELVEQAKREPGMLRHDPRLSNPLPDMQLGLIENGDDLENVAFAKRWLFQNLKGYRPDYDRQASLPPCPPPLSPQHLRTHARMHARTHARTPTPTHG